MAGIDFREVAARLPAIDFARKHLPMDRKGIRARCPWCTGSAHFNLAFFAKDGKAYCHKCHGNGDVVALAAQTWHVTQLDAARMLDDEFHLCIQPGMPAGEELRRRRLERERREAEAQAARAAGAAAAEELREAEAAVAMFTPADADNPATWAAIARFSRAQDTWHALREAAR